jgi:heptosyltransferase-1
MKIAIVKLSAMGDIAHAAIVLQFIKKHYPHAQIDWVCEKGFYGILEGNPHIHAIHTVNIKAIKKNRDFKALLLLIKKLRNLGAYDAIIDMQGLLKSAIVSRLIGKKTFGFDKNSTRESVASFFYKKSFDIPYDENTVDRNINVAARALGFEVTHKEALGKEPFLFYNGENFSFAPYLKERNVVFVIGSTWPSRNYPKELFAQLADMMQCNCLIVWGGEDEYERAQWIDEHSKFATVLPKLNLNELKALIAKADLLIGNDTGPTHMAWAMNVPSITIFGPTPISRVHITPINRVVKSPSIVDPFKLNKQDFSIKEIAPEEIVAIAKELLES